MSENIKLTMANVSIVIPVHNERDNISLLVQEIKDACSSYNINFEIIIIDDGSTDGTQEILASISNITVVLFRRNFGQTAAIDAGCQIAKNDYIVTMDGDGQNDPRDIIRLIEHLESGEFDVVSGWRKNRKDNFAKHFISRGANVLRKLLLNDTINDSGCSLKLYRKACFNNLRLYGEMHRFIPAILEMRGFSISEIEVNHRPRLTGKTKYNLFRTVKGMTDMMLLWFWRSYSVRPIHLLGGAGMIFIFLSFLLGLKTVYLYFEDQKLSSTLEPLLTVSAFIAGLNFVFFGILIDVLMKIYFSVSTENYYSIEKIVHNK